MKAVKLQGCKGGFESPPRRRRGCRCAQAGSHAGRRGLTDGGAEGGGGHGGDAGARHGPQGGGGDDSLEAAGCGAGEKGGGG